MPAKQMQEIAVLSDRAVLTDAVRRSHNHVAVTSMVILNPKRIDAARLAANMSNADLAFAVRHVSAGRLKPTEASVRRWIKGLHVPREGVVAAIAAATGKEIGFFYESDGADEEEDADLLRELARLPADLRRRIERRLARSAAS